MASVLLVTIHLALCSLFVFAPKMLGILVGMDQKDIYGDVGKDCALALLVLVLVFIAECGYGAVSKDCALALLGFGARVHCRMWFHGPDSANCLEVSQLQLIYEAFWKDFTRFMREGGPQSSRRCRRHPCRYAVAVPRGPVCSENHRGFPVRTWWSMSLFAGSPQVQSWMDCSDSQLQPLTLGLCAGLQVPQVRSVRRQSRSHCCCFTSDLQYIDKVVDVPVVLRMPVVVQQQVP